MIPARRPQLVQADLSHLERLTPLFDAYRVFYQQPSDMEAARSYLNERLRRCESVVFLANDPETAEPWGFTQLYPSFSSVGLYRIWILYDLYVVPERRRQGIGRLLMETAHQYARDAGARMVSLATAVDNLAGQRLYESMGYVRDEEFYYYDLQL